MNRRQRIIVSVTGIFIVLLVLLGLTYAYFLTRITGNGNPTSISVTTANLELVYGDGSTAILTSETPLMPSSTPIGRKDFTVTNNGDDSEYVVVFEDVTVKYAADTVIDGEAVANDTPTTFESNDFVYTLTCEVKDKSGNTLNDKSCDGVENETFPMDGGIVIRNSIDKNDVHNYILTLYYLDNGLDQSKDMNKALNGKVNIKDIKSINPYIDNTNLFAYHIINNSILNKNGTELVSKPLTTPAVSTPLEPERALSVTNDDYGTSYYYRGNVQDNYVNFAGMCWRVVRIEGDGSIKLLLEDRYTTCNDTVDADGTGTTDYAYTGNWSDDNNYVFYQSFGDNKTDFLNYEGGLADSFKTFQTSKLTTIDIEKLKVDEWCFDHNVTSTNEYCYGEDFCLTDEYYGAYTRIVTNKKPSLSCSGTKLTKFRDNIDMYVATLTADEISFAGISKHEHYLINTYAKDNYLNWWSLSPAYLYGEYGNDFAFYVAGDFLDTVDLLGNLYYNSRPAVTLKSGSVITGGEGTLEKPYIIAD